MAAFIGKASASDCEFHQNLLFHILDLPKLFSLGRKEIKSQGRWKVEVSISKLHIQKLVCQTESLSGERNA